MANVRSALADPAEKERCDSKIVPQVIDVVEQFCALDGTLVVLSWFGCTASYVEACEKACSQRLEPVVLKHVLWGFTAKQVAIVQ